MLDNDFDVPPELKVDGRQSLAPTSDTDVVPGTPAPLVAIEYRTRGLPFWLFIALQGCVALLLIATVRRLGSAPAHTPPDRRAGAEPVARVRAEQSAAPGHPVSVATVPREAALAPERPPADAPPTAAESRAPRVGSGFADDAPGAAVAGSAPAGFASTESASENGRPGTRALFAPGLEGEGPPLPGDLETPIPGTAGAAGVDDPPEAAAHAALIATADQSTGASAPDSPITISAEEVERQVKRESEQRRAEQELMLHAKEDAARSRRRESARQAFEHQLAFRRALLEIVRAGGATTGKGIEDLCKQYASELTPQQRTTVSHQMRALPDRATVKDQVALWRARGIPEAIILDELARSIARRHLNARGGVRSYDEARVRAARQLLDLPLSDPSRIRETAP